MTPYLSVVIEVSEELGASIFSVSSSKNAVKALNHLSISNL